MQINAFYTLNQKQHFEIEITHFNEILIFCRINYCQNLGISVYIMPVGGVVISALALYSEFLESLLLEACYPE
jgi:hypothetical protein